MRVYRKARFAILKQTFAEFEQLFGDLEADEAYFGGKRKGTRGRSPKNKEIVFGIVKRNDYKGIERVYTTVVENVSAQALLSLFEKYTIKGSVYYTDEWTSYKDLDKFGEHKTITHSSGVYVDYKDKTIHTNGIEGYWSFAKERFLKFHGVSHAYFLTYLKEYEWRFNHRRDDIFLEIVRLYFPHYKD
jgi:transposase